MSPACTSYGRKVGPGLGVGRAMVATGEGPAGRGGRQTRNGALTGSWPERREEAGHEHDRGHDPGNDEDDGAGHDGRVEGGARPAWPDALWWFVDHRATCDARRPPGATVTARSGRGARERVDRRRGLERELAGERMALGRCRHPAAAGPLGDEQRPVGREQDLVRGTPSTG